MNLFSKNNLLKFLPQKFEIETNVKLERIFEVKTNASMPKKPDCIIYLLERELRTIDNHALNFALNLSNKFQSDLKIIHPKIYYETVKKNIFINRQLKNLKKNFEILNLDFEISNNNSNKIIKNLPLNTILILDFNPILYRNFLNTTNIKIFEIDGHNVIPTRFISDKQEFSAATLRRKIYANIFEFLNEFPKQNITLNLSNLEAKNVLFDFIKNKLPKYDILKNDPTNDYTSNLSKYLNLGFISAQRVALEIIKSNSPNEAKEAFLEELIVRKELAENFCLYCKSFKTFDCIPNWAKLTLNAHISDLKKYIYTKSEFETSKTHDIIWNATQNQLKKDGKIHGYLRMYWAKKILEWSPTPEVALEIAIYLNDKYALDAPSANGYTGILWSIGALHDRAFKERSIIGKIRPMTANATERKFEINKYIKKYL